MGKTVSGVLGVRLGEGTSPPRGDDPSHSDEPAGLDPALPLTGRGVPTRPTPSEEDLAVPDRAVPDPAVQDAAVQDPAVQDPAVQDPAETDPAVTEPETVPADAVLAAAVEPARAVAREVGGEAVGQHLGVQGDGPTADGPVATHSFATTDRAYVGWRWAVTVARAEDSDVVTVDEVVLLPGHGALLAPAWVPWSERVQSGDVGPGDLLPPAADDARLVPSYAAPDGLDAALSDAVFLELGLGRPRVLSREGRLDAAERWWEGEAGPDSPVARQAPGRCVDCGFLVPLAGGLRQAFGVCANAVAPDDGRVVALAHGCGAHSETVVDAPHAATAGMAVEDDEFELVPTGPRTAAGAPVDPA